jgi:hypothetical protein
MRRPHHDAEMAEAADGRVMATAAMGRTGTLTRTGTPKAARGDNAGLALEREPKGSVHRDGHQATSEKKAARGPWIA